MNTTTAAKKPPLNPAQAKLGDITLTSAAVMDGAGKIIGFDHSLFAIPGGSTVTKLHLEGVAKRNGVSLLIKEVVRGHTP